MNRKATKFGIMLRKALIDKRAKRWKRDKIDGNLPTKSDMDNLLGNICMIPGDAKLEWRYLYDETGRARCIEVSDGKGFVSYMSEELFNRLGLNEKATKKA